MKTLKPFNPEAPLELWGELKREVDSPNLILNFEWRGELTLGSTELTGELGQKRKNQLWQDTCFECFLMTKEGRYIEWNFSPTGEWNCYAFSNYREPQPPMELEEAMPREIHISSQSFRAVFYAPDFERYQISAIIKTHETHYYALEHAKAKPDFHAPQAFQPWSEP